MAPTQKLEMPTGQETANLVRMLLRHGRHPERESARYRACDGWRSVSWGEVLERTRALSEGLVALGVKPGDRVCIFAATRLEWCLADLAVLGTGAVSVPIYSSNTAQETEYIIRDSGARIVFVDSDKGEGQSAGRWSRLRGSRERTPSVEQYVAFDLVTRPEDKLLSLADLEQQGRAALEQNPGGLEDRAARIGPEDLSCILYTSGTMGAPKGVMLTHASWVSQSFAVMQAPVLVPDDLVFLFLPLAHSFARAVEATWICQDVRIAFAESVEKILANCAEVKPTVVPSVPRVFEKAFNHVVAEGSAKPGLQGALFRRAMRQYEQYVLARQAGRPFRSPEWALLKKVIFGSIAKKLDARFGGQVRAFISGGAPLAPKIALFFELCGLHILEGYGLTETCAPTHANLLDRNRIGTVGPAFPGVEVRIAEDGEVLLRGPTIMRGYYQLPQETAAALSPDGWLRTGDIGAVDDDGMLRITDRKKDLIKTSGGKYIAPQMLENALKTEPLIGQVSIHGDGQRYVSALLTVSTEHAKRFAEQNQLPFGTLSELCQKPEIRARIQAAVDALNATQPSYATIKKFALLDHEWSQETGELTPTLKVKRAVVAQRYKDVLEELYR
ncbi:MAG: long-chain fatty acid--CoA ligase [Deltaproteobacteria bacterium]|nr:long-chain fatty acid--CoA ligase [Deltaproteobacteria bacterium]